MDTTLATPPEVKHHLAVVVRRLIKRIQFRHYVFHYDEDRQLLYATHFTDGQVWTTRKWWISEHVTESELVQTFLKLILTSVEHEAREAFLVDGKATHGPHLSLDKLLEIAEATVHRPDPVPANMPAPEVRHSPMPDERFTSPHPYDKPSQI